MHAKTSLKTGVDELLSTLSAYVERGEVPRMIALVAREDDVQTGSLRFGTARS